MDLPILTTQRTRIQAALIALVSAGVFYPVRYDPNSNKPIGIDQDLATPAKASSVLTNEVQSLFDIDSRMGRKRVLKRSSWMFIILADFDVEVTLEFFEEAMQEPTILPADPLNKLPQVTLELKRTSVTHPATQGSAGTRATFAFEATVARQ